MTDLIGGQVQVMFDTMAASIPHIKAGKVRPLAVTTAARSALLPELPTVGDFVPGYEASGPFGIAAPKNTPPEIVARINREMNALLAAPKVKATIAAASVRLASMIALVLWLEVDRFHDRRDARLLLGDRIGEFLGAADVDDLAGGFEPLADAAVRGCFAHVGGDFFLELL